jgi:uncharacterized protein (DUF1501 family)
MSNETHDADCGCQEYNELSRRQFIGAAAAGTAASMFPAWLPKIVLGKTFASNRDVIVSIFLRGGADGLALVAPYADSAYYAARPTIGIPRPDSGDANKGIDLDGFFAFAAGMSGLVPAFTAKDLLVVQATGLQTNNSRSHFDAQRFIEVGKPADPTVITGWLGRHLATMPPAKTGALLRGIGVSSGLQKTLVGAPQTLPISDPANFNIGGSANTLAQRLAFMQNEYGPGEEPLRSAALDAVNTVNLIKSVNFTGYTPANGAVYPNSGCGRALRSLAVLIKADVGLEAAQVDIGGWDTHSAQGANNGAMRNLMNDFSGSLGAFYADVIAAGATVTVVAISEFGRNVRENASGGNDHGRGTVMFAMGKGIAGGRVLTKNWITGMLDRANLEAGQDLKVTTDYRDILSEIVQNRLGNPNLDIVFPGWTPAMLGVTR